MFSNKISSFSLFLFLFLLLSLLLIEFSICFSNKSNLIDISKEIFLYNKKKNDQQFQESGRILFNSKLQNHMKTSSKIRLNNQHHKKSNKHQSNKQKALDRLIIKILQEYSELDMNIFEQKLQYIAIPRKIGSVGHQKVRKFIENIFHNISSSWTIREDRFRINSHDQTNIHSKNNYIRFRNIVATFEPKICQSKKLINTDIQRIVLACHYDSLNTKFIKKPIRENEQKFVGAIDAAVPCAILLDLAQILTPKLEKYHQKCSTKYPRLTLQLIFFDGEESLINTTPSYYSTTSYLNSAAKIRQNSVDDSLYGSKHLAKIWDRFNSSRLPIPPTLDHFCGNEIVDVETQYRKLQDSLYKNENIALFILLDLIGIHGTKFYNTNLATTGSFFQLALIEKQILSHLNIDINTTSRQFHTNPPVLISLVRDDHRPFLIRGIPTLALIPHPFPSVWHSHYDNINSLDMQAIERFRAILTVFIAKHFDSKTINRQEIIKKNE